MGFAYVKVKIYNPADLARKRSSSRIAKLFSPPRRGVVRKVGA